MRATLGAALALSAAAAGTRRDDPANSALVRQLDAYLAASPLSHTTSGAVTDARPVGLEWGVLGDMPLAWKDGVACWVAPETVLVAGGQYGIGEKYSYDAERRLVDNPGGVADCSLSGAPRNCSGSGWRVEANHTLAFDVPQRRWRRLRAPPYVAGRTQGACTAAGSLVMIAGGEGGSLGPRVLQLVDREGGAWSHLPALPGTSGRSASAAAALDDWLIITLGALYPKQPARQPAGFRLRVARNPGGAPGVRASGVWERMAPLPSSRYRDLPRLPIAAVVGDDTLLVRLPSPPLQPLQEGSCRWIPWLPS